MSRPQTASARMKGSAVPGKLVAHVRAEKRFSRRELAWGCLVNVSVFLCILRSGSKSG